MKCLKCNGDKFEIKEKVYSPYINGKNIEITSSAYICSNCNESLMDSKQMDEFLYKFKMIKWVENLNVSKNIHNI
jgi:YgiT-type zinc finger domain-containing protein